MIKIESKRAREQTLRKRDKADKRETRIERKKGKRRNEQKNE